MVIKVWPRTIRGLVITVALISTVMSLLLFAAMILVVHHELERQLDQRIEVETRSLLGAYNDRGFAELARIVDMRDRNRSPSQIGYLAGVDDEGRATGYMLVDAQGKRRAGSLDAPIPPPGWSEFLRFRRTDGSWGEAQALNTQLPGHSQLIITADRAILDAMHWKIFKLFAAGFGLMATLSLIVTIGFGRAVRHRLTSIETSAQAIMGGDLSRRMPLDGSGSEFDRLSDVLNRMLDRMGELLENLRQVSGDIAHDLRTPLQRVRARLDAMTPKAKGTALQQDLETVNRDTEELLDLFSSLLAISEIEGQSIRSRFVAFDLLQAVEDIADLYRPAIEERGATLTLAGEPVSVSGDRKLLQQVVANLLDNSLIHAPNAKRIDISVERAGRDAILLVSDDGPGIPPSEHQHIFRRLTRLDASRSKPGHGLGLSLVDAIMRAHDGTVSIEPTTVGLRICCSLPAVDTPFRHSVAKAS